MQTQTHSVFWVDLCADARNAQNIESIHKMSDNFAIRRVDKARITLAIEEERPHLICLDYDFPDRQNLQLLRQLRCEYQDIPVIMMTMQHSESLAVWAFRTGVRNYLVKPLPIIALIEELSNLFVLMKPHVQNQRAPRRNVIPPPCYQTNSATARQLYERTARPRLFVIWKCILMKRSQRNI